MPRADRLAILLLPIALVGCAGGRYEAPEPRYRMDTGGSVFAPKEQWREAKVTIPAYPKEERFQECFVKGPTDNRYYVDTESLEIGADGVVRYALVIRSDSGAQTVAYEGIRCETREWKPYAFGRADGQWSDARDPQWQRIVWRSTNAFRFALYRDYFCPDGYPLRDRGAALAELRRTGPNKDRNR